tara:strand:- start:5089 stop:5685 length:597 start_codon:yes stop_codon:yes gene_type:complete
VFRLKRTKTWKTTTLKEGQLINTVMGFMSTLAKIDVSAIKTNYYSGRKGGEGVNPKTGKARAGWYSKNTRVNPSVGRTLIGNKAPYHNYNKEKVITPKKGDYLAIPFDKGVDSKGNPRYSGPWDPAVAEKTKLIPLKGEDGYLVVDKSPKIRGAYFIYKKSVTIPAHTKRLPAYIEKRFQDDFKKVDLFLRKKFGASL